MKSAHEAWHKDHVSDGEKSKQREATMRRGQVGVFWTHSEVCTTPSQDQGSEFQSFSNLIYAPVDHNRIFIYSRCILLYSRWPYVPNHNRRTKYCVCMKAQHVTAFGLHVNLRLAQHMPYGSVKCFASLLGHAWCRGGAQNHKIL